MSQNFEKFLFQLTPPALPSGLFNRIIQCLQQEKNLVTAKKRMIIFSVFFVISLALLVPAFFVLRAGLLQSDFIKFVSLLFSDSRAVLAFWQSFVMALLESLPITSALIFFVALFLVLISLKFFSQSLKNIFSLKILKLINH